MTALILQHLPLQDRLAAARVCQTWAEAAALATSTIKLTALPAPKLQRLQSWLQQHGQQLTCLELDTEGAADNAVLQLPELHQLCSLMLTGCKLQLPSAARRSARSAAHAPAALLLPRLTSLHLGGFTVSTLSTLLQLTQVTSLRSLKLGAPYTSKAAAAAQADQPGAVHSPAAQHTADAVVRVGPHFRGLNPGSSQQPAAAAGLLRGH
jgi:hypothetical protein